MKENLSPARYFYLKEEIRQFAIPQNTSSYFISDAHNGKIPSRLFICFVSAEAMAGSVFKNPLKLSHYFLNYLSVSVEGRYSPVGPLKLDFTNGHYLNSYSQLYRDNDGCNSGSWSSRCDKSVQGNLCNPRITRQEYANGFTVFVIDMEPQSLGEFYPLTRHGCLKIDLMFSEPLEESAVMISLATFPGEFQIDYTRNVHIK
jgi:hypothetical protein